MLATTTSDVSYSKENDSFYKSLSLNSLFYQIPEMEITRELGLQIDGSAIDSNDKGNLILIMEEKAVRSCTQQITLHK